MRFPFTSFTRGFVYHITTSSARSYGCTLSGTLIGTFSCMTSLLHTPSMSLDQSANLVFWDRVGCYVCRRVCLHRFPYSVRNPDTRLSEEKYVVTRAPFSSGISVSYTHPAHVDTAPISLHTNVGYLQGGGIRFVGPGVLSL